MYACASLYYSLVPKPPNHQSSEIMLRASSGAADPLMLTITDGRGSYQGKIAAGPAGGGLILYRMQKPCATITADAPWWQIWRLDVTRQKPANLKSLGCDQTPKFFCFLPQASNFDDLRTCQTSACKCIPCWKASKTTWWPQRSERETP